MSTFSQQNIFNWFFVWTLFLRWIKRDQLDVTCFIISLFNAQHVPDVNTSILRSLRLICWVISWVVLLWFDVCWCCFVVWLGWFGVVSVCRFQFHRNSNTHRTKNNTTNVVIQQNSRKLLMMAILVSETCWTHKKWNKIASDNKLVFYFSTITMMHGPINLRAIKVLLKILKGWNQTDGLRETGGQY